MGWLSRPLTLSQLVDDLCSPEETEAYRYRTIRHALRGDALWMVQERTCKATGEKETFIVCAALEKRGADWAYKLMEESVGPAFYNCPVSYLELAPAQNPGWRERVRESHEAHAAERSLRRLLREALDAPGGAS